MLAISNNTRIFLFSGPTDMRKGFDGLSGLVAEYFDVELLSGHLFLFCNRKRDRIKLLHWDNDGLAIWYKRLEAGSYQLPKVDSDIDSLEIDQTQLSLLLSGIHDNVCMPQTVALPNEIEACHMLISEQDQINESLARDNEKLKFEIEQLKRYIYGQRSERHVEDDSQLTLFDKQKEITAETAEEAEVIEEEITYRRRKQSKSDRFPENLPREVQTIDVPEADRKCSCCGEEMPIIDTDVRERLEYIPAKMIVHEIHYPKRACGQCKTGVTVASPPTSDQAGAAPTSGSRYGFGVTAQIILSKYADHLPLYRLEDVFARAGVVIPRSTQVGLLDAAADLVRPLTDLMKNSLLQSNVIGMDDTPVRLQDPSMPGRMLASCCHTHSRRKFESAKSNDPQRAARALAYYRQLYDIEDRGSELSSAERLQLRHAESLPILDQFKTWLDVQNADRTTTTRSATFVA